MCFSSFGLDPVWGLVPADSPLDLNTLAMLSYGKWLRSSLALLAFLDVLLIVKSAGFVHVAVFTEKSSCLGLAI